MPRRAEIVIGRVRETKLGEILPPRQFGLDPVLRVHDRGLVDFLGGKAFLAGLGNMRADAGLAFGQHRQGQADRRIYRQAF